MARLAEEMVQAIYQVVATTAVASLLPIKIPQRLGNLDARPEQRGGGISP
jgi:hypothetical protein